MTCLLAAPPPPPRPKLMWLAQDEDTGQWKAYLDLDELGTAEDIGGARALVNARLIELGYPELVTPLEEC